MEKSFQVRPTRTRLCRGELWGPLMCFYHGALEGHANWACCWDAWDVVMKTRGCWRCPGYGRRVKEQLGGRCTVDREELRQDTQVESNCTETQKRKLGLGRRKEEGLLIRSPSIWQLEDGVWTYSFDEVYCISTHYVKDTVLGPGGTDVPLWV